MVYRGTGRGDVAADGIATVTHLERINTEKTSCCRRGRDTEGGDDGVKESQTHTL